MMRPCCWRTTRAARGGAPLARLGVTVLMVLTLSQPSVSAQDSLPLALASAYGQEAAQRGTRLVELLRRLRRSPVERQLSEVNAFFNRFSYRADEDLWRTADHWSTPLEFIGRGAGDCEDFAIGKYFALRWLGFSPRELRVTYVRDRRSRRSHTVLEYRPPGGGSPLVLDNLAQKVSSIDERSELGRVFGFNEHRISVPLSGRDELTFPHAGRWTLDRWQQVLRRAGREAP